MTNYKQTFVKGKSKEYQYDLIAREIVKAEIRHNHTDGHVKEYEEEDLDFYADTILSERHNKEKYTYMAMHVIRKVKWMLSADGMEDA